MKEGKDNSDKQLYQFGEFTLEPTERILLHNGQPIPLTPKAFDTLLVLVEHSGHVLTKEELLQQIWPNSTVAETTLAQNVSTLRKALGPPGQELIQTIPKRGYRFTGQVVQRLNGSNGNPGRNGIEVGVEPTAQSEIKQETELPLPAPANKPKLLPYQLTIALLFITIPSAIAYFVWFRQPPKPQFNALQPRSLAVLPFRNLKQDSATEFLGFSLADAIITKLGYVSSLTVRPSSYVDKYRAREIDPKRVAVELNINTLLTGTYIKEGSDLRITAQLVDVLTNEILWKDSLELKYENLMTVQDRVSEQVIRGLQLNLTTAEADRLHRDAPQHPLAYEYYLRGVDFYSVNNLRQAISMLERSLTLDPRYPLAWVHLGAAHTARASINFGGREDYERAQQAYQKALALNPEQNEARISMATFLTDTNRVEEAVPLLRDVIKANPTNAQAHWELSYAYRFAGMLKESAAEAEQARHLDSEIKASNSVPSTYLYLGQYDKFLSSLPRNDSPYVSFYRGLGLYYLKETTRAASEFNRAFARNSEMMQTNIGKALALAVEGQPQQGLTHLRETEKIVAARGVNDAEAVYKIAQAYAVLGDKAAALRVLQRSIEGGFFCAPYFSDDPFLESVRTEKEFATLLAMARRRHEEFKHRFF